MIHPEKAVEDGKITVLLNDADGGTYAAVEFLQA